MNIIKNISSENNAKLNANQVCDISVSELYQLSQLWRAASVMIKSIADAEPELRTNGHALSGRFYSIAKEYARLISETRNILEGKINNLHP